MFHFLKYYIYNKHAFYYYLLTIRITAEATFNYILTIAPIYLNHYPIAYSLCSLTLKQEIIQFFLVLPTCCKILTLGVDIKISLVYSKKTEYKK